MPASVRMTRSSSRAARAMPTAMAATIGLVLSKVSMAPPKPLSVLTSGSPSRFSLGIRAFSKRITAVSEALMPNLCSRTLHGHPRGARAARRRT